MQPEAGIVNSDLLNKENTDSTAKDQLSDKGSSEDLDKENVDNDQTDSANETTTDDKQIDLEQQQTEIESNGETNKDQVCVELTNIEIAIEQAHFEALSKFLDVSGSKLNYRRYGEVLLDIIIAGGTLGLYMKMMHIYNLY